MRANCGFMTETDLADIFQL